MRRGFKHKKESPSKHNGCLPQREKPSEEGKSINVWGRGTIQEKGKKTACWGPGGRPGTRFAKKTRRENGRKGTGGKPGRKKRKKGNREAVALRGPVQQKAPAVEGGGDFKPRDERWSKTSKEGSR